MYRPVNGVYAGARFGTPGFNRVALMCTVLVLMHTNTLIMCYNVSGDYATPTC
jgi:hypothetical protein